MKKIYRVQREIKQWVEVVLEAEDLADAYRKAEEAYDNHEYDETGGGITWTPKMCIESYTEEGFELRQREVEYVLEQDLIKRVEEIEQQRIGVSL